ncbi:MAG: poly-beta-1,6-N-acetyl-D-glucosamine synthase [Alphaproteobacteria bacterium]
MTRKILGLSIILFCVLYGLVTGYMLDFIFLYPLFMSIMWIIGGLYFYFHWERGTATPDVAPKVSEYPFVSVLIPCYNEGANVAETIEAANAQSWPDFEIIAINDGSSDDTGAMLDRLALEYPRLRVIQFATNQGKAMALRMGALVAKGEYLVCIDGDAMIHPNGVAFLVKPLVDNPRVGAVTGNPRVRTRSTFIGKIQVAEFSSIIGLIKRAQRIYGHLFTISGVICSFRRRALHDCGYWDLNMVTEDIDISWSLQLRHWAIQYEPNALCWILMPETLRGLWKQRLRWAQGGAEVFFKNIVRIWKWMDHRMWILVFDFILSTVWAYSYLLSLVLWGLGKFFEMPATLNVPTIFPPAFWGLVLAFVNMVQFATAMTIETRYENKLLRLMGWIIWYPLVFWIISMFTILVAVPKAFFKSRKKRAAWGSSDRGFR